MSFKLLALDPYQEAMFTACSACTFLKNLLDKTPRGETEILGAVGKRLGQTRTHWGCWQESF